MVNLTMERTIDRALRSVLYQINPSTTEVVVLDGGSSDRSMEILEGLSSEHPNLKVFGLSRDNNRKIGEDRNLSVKLSSGECLILHIDCDDVQGPFIQDFITVFHAIEEAKGRDIVLQGRQLHMMRRRLFERLGGYKNITFEDRDLWMRALEDSCLVCLNHKRFSHRLGRSFKQRIKKNFVENYQAIESDMRLGLSLREVAYYYAAGLLNRKTARNSVIKLFFIVVFFSWNSSRFYQDREGTIGPVYYSQYVREHTRCLTDLTHLSADEWKRRFVNKDSMDVFINV